MKRLILVRHAKSSWSGSDIEDHDRPLNQRGRETAPKVGAWIKSNALTPDQVLSSTAARCRETWDGMAAKLSGTPDVQFVDDLYLADANAMLHALQGASGDTVMIIGHMPGIGEFARELRRDPPPLHDSFQKYPTGAVTVLEFRVDDWKEAQMGLARFVDFAAPSDFS